MFIYFITKSFLNHSIFHLQLLYQSYLCLCQATCVQSHQKQPRLAVAHTCEVQVSTTDSQTFPIVANGGLEPLCCRLTLICTLTSENLSLYTTPLLYCSLYNYTAHAAVILTPTTVVQCVDNHSREKIVRCYCITGYPIVTYVFGMSRQRSWRAMCKI